MYKFVNPFLLLETTSDQKLGALRRMPIVRPPMRPAMGIVMIQLCCVVRECTKVVGDVCGKTYENIKRPTRLQLTALNVPLQSPTPTVAPVMPEDMISMVSSLQMGSTYTWR